MQTATSNLSPGAARWIRISAIITMLVVAVSSAVLSFDGLQKLALASQVPEHLAFLFPIAVDMTILMGSLAVLLYEMFGLKARFGWFTVLFGTGLSVTGNVISVTDSGLIAQVLHGIIPILLCISLESLLRILRFNIRRGQDGVASIHERSESGHSEDSADMDAQVQESTDTNDPEAHEVIAVAPAPVIPVSDAPKVTSRVPEQVEPATSIQPESVEPVSIPDSRDTEVVSAPQKSSGDDWLVNARAKLDEMANTPTSQDPATEIFSPSAKELDSPESEAVEPTATHTVGETKKDVVREPVFAQQRERAEAPVISVTETSSQTKKPDAKASKKRATSTVPPLEDYERDDFKALIDAMPEDTPAVQKLGSVFKIKDTMPAADVRWLLGYEDGKRVDSLMRRARDWASTN